MPKTAFLFPGQGAQSIGMGKDFYENESIAKEVFDMASEAVGLDIKTLCFEENDDIHITEYTQIAMLTVCQAMAAVVKDRGMSPDVTAGLSLGEYTALVTAETMNFIDAAKVVRKRGIFMQEAVPPGVGGMSAVMGMDADTIEEVLNGIEGVQIANYNAPGQIVISGYKEALGEAERRLKEAGGKRVIPLNVSGPFHSSLLIEAGSQLKEVLDQVEVLKPTIPYVANVTAGYVTDEKEICPLLIKQVSSSVRWQQSVETMIGNGVDTFIEIGPGKTLAGFMKRINKEVTMLNIEKLEDVEKVFASCKS